MSIARAGVVLLATVCAGCAGGSNHAGHWDGRRGYDGKGDYGYDLAASRSEAGGYRTRAARSYAAPGTPEDPWGPYIREAAARFRVPERWIRAVMRQESGGRLYETDGSLMTSSAGAMGLMQVMPRTYDMLQQRYGLAGDPFDPRDNILAGTAYIREMYDRYGSPAFLAAYNAGPDRLEAYLSGGNPLPDETVNYLASVAPRLGPDVAASGPLATYAGAAAEDGAAVQTASAADRRVGPGVRRWRAGDSRRADRHLHGGAAPGAGARRRRGDAGRRVGHPGRRVCGPGQFRGRHRRGTRWRRRPAGRHAAGHHAGSADGCAVSRAAARPVRRGRRGGLRTAVGTGNRLLHRAAGTGPVRRGPDTGGGQAGRTGPTIRPYAVSTASCALQAGQASLCGDRPTENPTLRSARPG